MNLINHKIMFIIENQRFIRIYFLSVFIKIKSESDEALQRLDFLDSIKHDSIIGSWSIQADESKTQVTVRSLLWPGYLGYQRTNSNIFGGVYFG